MTTNEAYAGRPSSSTNSGMAGRQKRDIALAAQTDACILLTGRANPAQDLAYQLHLASGWRHGVFTVIDCESEDPALESQLLDALFSTDHHHRPSEVLQLRLVQAGTVLLREINKLPLPIQRQLAARLSDLWASPGPCRSRRRVMASSSEPLLDRVLGGTFDDSLYYRLNVMHFFLPGWTRPQAHSSDGPWSGSAGASRQHK